MIETPTKQQKLKPSVNILYEAALIERPDFLNEEILPVRELLKSFSLRFGPFRSFSTTGD